MTARCGTSNAFGWVFSTARTLAYCPGRRRLPGFGKITSSAMVPVFTETCRSIEKNVPFSGNTWPSASTSSDRAGRSASGVAIAVVSSLENFRYSCSLIGNFALIGSTVETAVKAPVLGPTRSPMPTFARPATPSTGAVTFVKARFNAACCNAAFATSMLATFARFDCKALS